MEGRGKVSACNTSDREAPAARRDVGRRLTSESRSAPPDAAHAPYLKELTPALRVLFSRVQPPLLKTAVTSSFLTRKPLPPFSRISFVLVTHVCVLPLRLLLPLISFYLHCNPLLIGQ